MNVKIYQRAKNAMQSGRAKAGIWILEYERKGPRRPEPLMGWTRAGDTNNQVSLKFSSQQEAISYAEEMGWAYDLQHPNQKKIKPRNYGDNFRYFDPQENSSAGKK